jgi:pimeloyl-ACP methyl ester carboxylesterase
VTTPDSSPVHVERVGSGPRVVFVHGSIGHGSVSFEPLRELADRYTLEFMDRRGFGQSIPREHGVDFDLDAEDVAGLLGDGAHLIGHSYGGVVSILATARRPEAVRSLTVVEPPFFSLAADHPAVLMLRQRLADLFPAPTDMGPGRWLSMFASGMGSRVPLELPFGADEVADIRASMTERPPWEATVDLGLIRSTGVPALVIRGDWSPDPPAALIGGAAFGAIADVLVRELDATSLVAPGATHRPQVDRADIVVPQVRAFLDAAEAGVASR